MASAPKHRAGVSGVEDLPRAGDPSSSKGALRGLSAGADAKGGDIALSLERMNAIEEIDALSATMIVQVGAILQTVQDRATAEGFYFPLDLGARGSCMIVGVLATDAGGNRVIKYGMARDQVLAVEAVLADGSVVGGLHKMIKNNAGYDLKDLLIGSEGTLGVITRAVLRIRPQPTATSTAWCALPDFRGATTLLRRAQAELSGEVSAFEVMWPSYYDFVLGPVTALRHPLSDRYPLYVLLETNGVDAPAMSLRFEGFLARMLEEGVTSDAAIATAAADAEAFWAIRDAPGEFPPSCRIGSASTSASPSVIWSRRPVQRSPGGPLARCHRATLWPFGDGNIHLVVDPHTSDHKTVEAIETVVYYVVSNLNGSVSAEHGIGLKKLSYLSRSRTAQELDAMRAVTRALDPTGILAPGRLFAS